MTRRVRLARFAGLAVLGGTLLGLPASRRVPWAEAEVVWKILTLGMGWWSFLVYWIAAMITCLVVVHDAPEVSDEIIGPQDHPKV